MRIAVLMSTYNGEVYIKEQINSILAQEGDFSLDLWVRDDGSTDGTCTILQEYAAQKKLNWYAGENLKPAKSFLDLVYHCPGYDYYAFADQDDYWYPTKLQNAVNALSEHAQTVAMYFANVRLVDKQLQPLGRNTYRQKPHADFYSLVCAGGILGCTMVLNAPLAALLQNAPAPEALIMHDAYAAIVCAMFGGQILYEAQPQMDYRQHGNNVVGSHWSKTAALKDRIRKITTPQKVSIASQASSLLTCFPNCEDSNKLAFLRKVANYRQSFFSAASLALSRKPRFNSRNMAITMRLSILLKNR